RRVGLRREGPKHPGHAFPTAVLLSLIRYGVFRGFLDIKPQDAPELIELRLEEIKRLEGGAVFEEPVDLPAGRGRKLVMHLRLDHSQLPGDRLNSLENCVFAVGLGLPRIEKGTALGVARSFHDDLPERLQNFRCKHNGSRPGNLRKKWRVTKIGNSR